MTQIILNTPLVAAPAIPAVTSTQVTVLEVIENFGWNYDPTQPGSDGGRGRPQSVEVTVLLNSDPRIERRLTVWEGAAYLAVRGTWTDTDLAAQITTLLSAS